MSKPAKAKNQKRYAATFGQDLMRGEHTVANKNKPAAQDAPTKARSFSPHVGLFEELSEGKQSGKLGNKFLVPPFTVLNAREGWWQDRKRAWLELGIKSELGRGNDAAPGGSKQPAIDPVTGKICRADSKGRPIAGTVAKVHQAIPGRGTSGLAASSAYKPSARKVETEDLRGGLTHRTTNDPYRVKERPTGLGGTLMKSLSSHPRYYEQKTATEKRLGRKITPEEFETDHWVDPDSEIISGTSIFDPVLCELAYKWFSPPGGLVLDPFAGGSVRGIVAAKLGRKYTGIDLSARQIAANRVQASDLCVKGDPVPKWIVGDSRNVEKLVGEQADFLWTCPPYADLEVYSDDPKDLSQLGYAEFVKAYTAIIKSSCARLKPDRFAGIVVGDVRGKDGLYYGFPWDTIAAFKAAGLRLHNEAVLVTAVGSLPIRAGRQFSAGRKLGKTHQNVFIFIKGDPKRASEACGVFDE